MLLKIILASSTDIGGLEETGSEASEAVETALDDDEPLDEAGGVRGTCWPGDNVNKRTKTNGGT